MNWAWIESPGAIEEALKAVALYGARATVASMVMPPLNGDWLGLSAGALRILMGAWVAALVMGPDFSPPGTGAWILLLLKECLIGLLLGVAAASAFWVAEGVGSLLDTQSGFNTIQQFQSMSGEENTPLGQLFLLSSITIFYVVGGMTVFMTILLDSYRWWPVGSLWLEGEVLWQSLMLSMPHAFFDLLATAAGALVSLLLLIEAAVGLMGRAADKLELNTLTQPIKMLALLSVLALLAPRAWESALDLVSVQTVCLFLGGALPSCSGG